MSGLISEADRDQVADQLEAARVIAEHAPKSRELALVITKIQEAEMWLDQVECLNEPEGAKEI